MKNRQTAYWIIIVLIAAVYTALESLTPFEYDNFVFDAAYMGHNGGSTDFSWRAFLLYIDEIRCYDNMRMGNIIAPLTTLMMPKWVFNLATGLCMALIVGGAARISSRRADASALALVWIMVVVFLPWRNNIFTGDYALNYIFAGALAMVAANAAVDRRHWLLIAASALLGAWHEGFALPLAAGFAAVVVAERRNTDKWLVAALLVMAAVAVGVFLCPGMLERLGRQGGGGSLGVKAILFNNCLAVVLVAVILVGLRIPRLRCTMAQRPFVMLATASLAGAMLSYILSQSARTSFAPQLYAIAALSYLLYPVISERYSAIVKALAICAVVLCTTHGIYACVWQNRMKVQFDSIMAELSANPGTTVFRDIIMPEDVPLLTLGFPSRSTFVEPFTYQALASWPEFEGSAVVPTALCDTLPDTAGITAVGNAYYGPAGLFGPKTYGTATADLPLPDGTILQSHPVFYIEFTDLSSTRHTYLKPFFTPRKIL